MLGKSSSNLAIIPTDTCGSTLNSTVVRVTIMLYLSAFEIRFNLF